jgi:hypothetical protein
MQYLVDAAYVGLATVAGFVWWFVYSDAGPKLPYKELVRFNCLLGVLSDRPKLSLFWAQSPYII